MTIKHTMSEKSPHLRFVPLNLGLVQGRHWPARIAACERVTVSAQARGGNQSIRPIPCPPSSTKAWCCPWWCMRSSLFPRTRMVSCTSSLKAKQCLSSHTATAASSDLGRRTSLCRRRGTKSRPSACTQQQLGRALSRLQSPLRKSIHSRPASQRSRTLGTCTHMRPCTVRSSSTSQDRFGRSSHGLPCPCTSQCTTRYRRNSASVQAC